MRDMRHVRFWLLGTVALLVATLFPFVVAAESGDDRGDGQTTVLIFESTAMLANTPPAGWPTATSVWPPNGTNPSVNGMAATGRMEIQVVGGHTHVRFVVRGARSKTLYTIWTDFKPLLWCADSSTGCPGSFSPPGRIVPGVTDFPAGALKFYPEAGAVAPTAAMSKAFTSGMGPDPGATFFTDERGDGEVTVKLDYNLLGTTYDDGPPVGNADVVAQC
ncbi:MAG: hypothetical protein HY216_00005, partial [Candidatus Rokubacteria bacterium]|nr:hypothetical protein [Candidatus Rokubacteria bacterium]